MSQNKKSQITGFTFICLILHLSYLIPHTSYLILLLHFHRHRHHRHDIHGSGFDGGG